MQARTCWAVAVLLGLCSGCLTPERVPKLAPSKWVEGEYLLRMRAGTDKKALEDVLQDTGGTLLNSYTLVPGLHLFRSALPVERVLRVKADRDVEYIHRNRTLGLAAQEEQPDPEFWRQWALWNSGSIFEPDSNLYSVAGSDIRAVAGWDWSTAYKFKVAVIDTGLDLGHPDLAGNLWTNPDEIEGLPGEDDDPFTDAEGHDVSYPDDRNGWDFVDEDNVPQDGQGHGTAVASILGAVGRNGVGMSGVALRCRIMPLRAFQNSSNGVRAPESSIVLALQYAVNEGARVSCNSYGELLDVGDDVAEFQSLWEAILGAGEQGHLFVAAAGNEGVDIGARDFVPASFDGLSNMLVVTGVDYNDHFAGFNWSPAKVHLAAPSNEIFVARDSGFGSGYGYEVPGTSFAAPHVAGAAALYWSWRPTSTMAEVRDKILASVRKLPELEGKVASGGVLDVGGLFPGPELRLNYLPLSVAELVELWREGYLF